MFHIDLVVDPWQRIASLLRGVLGYRRDESLIHQLLLLSLPLIYENQHHTFMKSTTTINTFMFHIDLVVDPWQEAAEERKEESFNQIYRQLIIDLLVEGGRYPC